MKLVPLQTFGNRVNPLLAQRQAMGQPLGTPRIIQGQKGQMINMGASPEYVDAMFNQQIFRDNRLNQNAVYLEGLKQKNALEAASQKFDFEEDLEGIKNKNALAQEALRAKNVREETLAREALRAKNIREESDRVFNRNKEEDEFRTKRDREREKELLAPFAEVYQKNLDEYNAFIRGIDNGSQTKQQFREELQAVFKRNFPNKNPDNTALTPEQRKNGFLEMGVFVDRAERDREAQIRNAMNAMLARPIPGLESTGMKLDVKIRELEELERTLMELLKQKGVSNP